MKKRKILQALAFVALAAPPILMQSPLEVMASTQSVLSAYETTANLHLRQGSGVSHKSITVMPKGAKVELVSKESNGWVRIRYGGREGYASGKYIKGTSIALPSTGPSTTKKAEYHTTANLNMRTGPTTGYKIIMTLPKGTKINVESYNNGWYKINHNGKSGYVIDDYVKVTYVSLPSTGPTPTAPATPAAPTVITGDVYKTTASLNMRSGDSVSHRVVRVLPKGAEVKYLETAPSGWYKVTYSGVTGYVSNKYIAVTKASPQPQPEAPTPIPAPTPEPTPAPAPVPTPTPTPPVSGGAVDLGPGGSSESYVSNTTKNHTLEAVPGSKYIPLSQVSKYEVKTKMALNMRKGAGTTHEVLLSIPKGVSLLREELMDNGWAKVTYNGVTGYINSSETYAYTIPVVWKEDSAFAKIDRTNPNKALGVSAIENAMTQLTKPYQWGAEGPVDYDRDGDTRIGFDCSGLTQWAYYESGKMIPRTTATGYNKGQQVSRENIQVGDLIYFKTTSSSAPVTHVAMYLGDNMMLHASSAFAMTSVSEVYWDKMVTITRWSN